MLPINPMDPSVTAVKNGDSTPEEAAKQMEAMFVHMILKEIRKTMPDNVFGGGQAGEMYQDMLDSEMAKEIAASGNLGLADQLKELIPAAGAKNDKARRLQQGIKSRKGRHAAPYYSSPGQRNGHLAFWKPHGSISWLTPTP